MKNKFKNNHTDLGTVKRGSLNKATFSYTGSSRIILVKTGCGCSEAVVDNKNKQITFKIKAATEFPFQLKAKGIKIYEKYITPTVSFNDGTSYKLQIKIAIQ